MNKTERLIQEFISKIKSKYGSAVDVQYEYNIKNKEYDIWHNNAQLQFESKEFQEFIGEQINTILFDNDVFDFSFGYDYFKSKNTGWIYFCEPRDNTQIEITINDADNYLDPEIYDTAKVLVEFVTAKNFQVDFVQSANPNENYIQPECFFDERLDKYKQILKDADTSALEDAA